MIIFLILQITPTWCRPHHVMWSELRHCLRYFDTSQVANCWPCSVHFYGTSPIGRHVAMSPRVSVALSLPLRTFWSPQIRAVERPHVAKFSCMVDDRTVAICAVLSITHPPRNSPFLYLVTGGHITPPPLWSALWSNGLPSFERHGWVQ